MKGLPFSTRYVFDTGYVGSLVRKLVVSWLDFIMRYSTIGSRGAATRRSAHTSANKLQLSRESPFRQSVLWTRIYKDSGHAWL